MSFSAGARFVPYEIPVPLGAGGMGEEYCARDPRPGRAFAIEVPRELFSHDSLAVARLEREAPAAAALSHLKILERMGLAG
jgi:serine/threonine protein kinase